MELTFISMKEKYAKTIVEEWHYEGIYDFYDMVADEEDLQEFINPDNWPDRKFAVVDEGEELVGYYSFSFQEESMWIGFGLRPDLTGKGYGQDFVLKGIAFGIEYFDYKADHIMLAVAEFNKRAIKTYERIGFRAIESYKQKTNGGEYNFIKMKKTL